jgi:hypothetical protein
MSEQKAIHLRLRIGIRQNDQVQVMYADDCDIERRVAIILVMES